MLTKYNTGDKVLIEATIEKAYQSGNEILYDIAECNIPIKERQIKNHAAYIDIRFRTDAFDGLKAEIRELDDIVKRARSIMDDLAQKEINVDVCLGEITTEIPHEADGHSEDIGIRLNESKKVFHTEGK